jgi:hypothetical protein
MPDASVNAAAVTATPDRGANAAGHIEHALGIPFTS